MQRHCAEAESRMAHSFAKVAVVGAGAVGSFFGALLARAGHRVVLIARPAHVQAIRRDGLRLDKGGSIESIPVEASDDIAAVRDAYLILFFDKSTATETAALAMAPHIAPGAVVLSLQNGVENASAIARIV